MAGLTGARFPGRRRHGRRGLQGLSIGIDIGGTKVAAGVVDDRGTVLHALRRDTEGQDPRAVEATIVEVVRELGDAYPVVAVGIGAAGWIDQEQATVLFSPHLAWRNEPLHERLRTLLRREVLIENDANAAAWAEWRFGAARGENRLLCVTLGTGIGGAVVNDGVVERGRFGLAGEFGHMILVPGGHRCECGNRGCWEQYASGNALGREARELARAGSPVAHRLLEAVGGDVDAIRGPLVTRLAQEGDPVCRELFDEVGHWLGIGLANLAAALDPGTIVIGGGVSAAGDLLLEPARRVFAKTLTGRGFRPPARIVRAELGPEAGMVGAADLARHRPTLRRRLAYVRHVTPRRERS